LAFLSSHSNCDNVEVGLYLGPTKRIQPAKPMRVILPDLSRCASRFYLLALTIGSLLTVAFPSALGAQENRNGEIVANLAAGRVVFCVTRDSIIVAAVAGGGEVGSRQPAVLPVGPGRIGVLLGAIDWTAPDAGKATRLDSELPAVASNALRRPTQKATDQASEIEAIGVGMLEEIRPLVDQIHHKLDLPPEEPLVELLLADYVQDYGPEIWSLQYHVRQQDLGKDYWQTRLLRPAYVQLYPPEKGQPRTFVEAGYPANVPQLRLADRLARHDPQLDRIANSSRDVSESVASIAAGNSIKALSSPSADFMRAAIPLAVGDQTNLVMALLDMNRGFQWLLAPQEPIPPGRIQQQPTEPDAPSLRKRGPRPQ